MERLYPGDPPIKLDRCPHRYLREQGAEEWTAEMIALFALYQDSGALWAGGGIKDQPAVYVDALFELRAEVAFWQESQNAKLREKLDGQH